MWVSTKEAAKLLGKSMRTIQRQIAAGKLESREVPGVGRSGVVFEVLVNKNKVIPEKTNDTVTVSFMVQGEWKEFILPRDHGMMESLEADREGRCKNCQLDVTGHPLIYHKKNEGTKYCTVDFLKYKLVKPAGNYDFKIIKTIPEKTNDIKTNDIKTNDISAKNTPTNDILTNDSVVSPVSDKDNKDLAPTNDRLTTPTVQHPKTVKSNKQKEMASTNDIAQCTVQPTMQSVVSIDNTLQNNELKFFITMETTVQLTRWVKRTVFNKINSNKITSIKQPKDGGGFRTMIDVRTLPLEAQEKWKQLAVHENPDSGLISLSENQRRYAFAMESAMMVWLRYRDNAKDHRIRKQDADKRFENDIKTGKILTSEVNILNGVSVKTLYRHLKKWEISGRRTSVFAPDRQGHRGRKPVQSDIFYALANTWIITQPATKAAHLYNQLTDAILAKQPKTKIPSYPTFLKYYKDVKERQALVIAGVEGKKTLDNIMPYVPRDNDALPGEVWQYDGYIMKTLVHNPWLKDGLIKPVVVYFFDVSTGLVTGWAVSFSERSDVIAGAWHHAMTRFPAPRILQPDNPAGIYNEQLCAKYIVENETRKKYLKLKQRAIELTMSGRNGIFFDCGLERIKFVTPGNSKGKKIEPAHFHIFRGFETQPRFRDVYVGKSPDDRPEHLNRTNKAILNDKKLNIPEWDWMVEAIGKHIEYYNNRKKKSLQNFSPQEAYLQMVDITKKLTSEELKYKALWTEEKTTRSGYIKLFDDILYRHAAFTVMRNVKIGYNVNDLSKVRVFGADGREMSTPAVMVQKGSYVQDEVSAEAIKANKTFKKKAIALQKELLVTDIKKLNNKQLVKLLDQDLDQKQKELIQERLNEIEKYPEFGKIQKESGLAKASPNVEDIRKEEPIPDLSHIIDADFEEVEEPEDDTWLDEIINKEEDEGERACQGKPRRKEEEEEKKKLDETLKRLGIGG